MNQAAAPGAPLRIDVSAGLVCRDGRAVAVEVFGVHKPLASDGTVQIAGALYVLMGSELVAVGTGEARQHPNE